MDMDPSVSSNARMTEMQARIRALMEQPPPRDVPDDIRRLAISPIANFLILMGWLEIMLCAILTAVLVLSNRFSGGIPRSATIAIGAISCVAVILITWGIYARRRAVAVLKYGRLDKGSVITVSPLPALINARTFFSVAVRLPAPDGREIIGRDVVDNWAVEYFLKARDAQTEIDVIHRPGAPRKVILPTRLGIGYRFD